MTKCIICDKPTKWKYSIDPDLPSFGYCKKHEFDVQIYVVLLQTDNNFNPEKWLKNARRNAGEKVAKRTTKKGK